MRNIPIHECARPGRLEAGLVEALRARRIPGWWLYEGPQQARRWLAYHQAWSPSRADTAMAEVYAQAFAGAVAQMPVGQMAAEQMAGSIKDSVNGGVSGGISGTVKDRVDDAVSGTDKGRAGSGTVTGRAGGGLHLVGLGCGGGRKDAALLGAALQRLGGKDARALRYFPLDASAELVAEAAAQVAERLPSLPISPLVADLGAYPDLNEWLMQGVGEEPGDRQEERQSGGGGTARLFTCFGMTPNFDHAAFPRYLRGLLRPRDGLLISANLSPRGMAADGRTILAQYDNPPAREWYAGALENLGLAHGAYKLEVSARPLSPDGGIWQVVVEAGIQQDKSQQAAILKARGVQIPLRQGERLEVFFSNRFTHEAFAAVLADAGLEVIQEWLHGNGEEGVFYCRVSSP